MELAQHCRLSVTHLPADLAQNLRTNFQKLFYYHPQERASICYNHAAIPTYRWQRSYGQVPVNDYDAGFFMFHGKDEEQKIVALKELEPEFKQLLDWVNHSQPESLHYNQVTICWYESPDDYIPPHKDMDRELCAEAGVTIVNLCKSDEAPRVMSITANGRGEKTDITRIDVRLTHGCVIHMTGKDFQRKYKHGVAPVTTGNPGPRIAVSLRRYGVARKQIEQKEPIHHTTVIV